MAKSAAGPLASGSIDNFLGSFQNHGYLETNKFEVVLYPPFDINNRRNFSGQDQADIVDQTINGRQTQEHITLRAESVNLAGRNITSFEETNIYGPVKQIPTGVSFAEDINVTFLASIVSSFLLMLKVCSPQSGGYPIPVEYPSLDSFLSPYFSRTRQNESAI